MGLLYNSSILLKTILDSLEDQEGGAMYISCDVSNGGPVEPETGYVPNNPLFGLALDSPQQECAVSSCVGCLSCQGTTALPIPSLTSSDFDCGSCFDPASVIVGGVLGTAQNNTQPTLASCNSHLNINNNNNHNNHNNNNNNNNSHNNNSTNFWTTDEMASTFPGLPPLDIDPLPSLFPFSPCGASYNFSTNPHQASLSYTVHPHQMLISPNSHNQNQQNHQQQASHGNTFSSTASSCFYDSINNMPVTTSGGSVNTGSCGQHLNTTAAAAAVAAVAGQPIYPSMSVNVSMNMTMHSYGATDATMPMQCSQMQWTPPNSSSSVNVLYPPLLSPTHYPTTATYSFTADFRPPALQSNQNITTGTIGALTDVLEKDSISPPPLPLSTTPTTLLTSQGSLATKNFYSTTQLPQNYSPPSKSPEFTPTRDSKSFGSGYEDEDSNDECGDSKPNLCRLCGKTYARPSTLKTHLRTHSGERPYRCPDCNKSFSQAANLTAHVRTHTGQKPFRCPICDRRFSQSSSVTTHMRTHSGERPYRCNSCKKSFSDSSTLTKHLRIHSGEKPYQCKLCLLRFSQSGNLNRHMRVHGTNNNGNNQIT